MLPVDHATPLDAAQSVLGVLTENAAAVDQMACFPDAGLRALRSSGLLGLLVPVDYGGMGGDLGDMVEIAQVLASSCLSTAMIWAMHCQQVDSLVRFATAELADRLLPRIARGDVYLASVTTEPTKGGYLLSSDSPLTRAGAGLRVARDAPIVTGGEYADGYLVTMRTAKDANAQDVTLVYVERDQLKLTSSGAWDPMGMRGTHSRPMRLDATVPADQVVGVAGRFREVAVESMIPAAHLGWSACWLGTARQALSDVVSLLRSPSRPRSVDRTSDLIAERIARARLDVELVGAYLFRVRDEVLAMRSDGISLGGTATQLHINGLKIVASELTFSCVDRLVQLVGLSTGYMKTSTIPLERHFRDLRSASLNHSNDRLLSANGRLTLFDRSVNLP